MRTEKKYEETIALSEWRKDVAEHYSAEKQQARVDDLIDYVVKYCREHFINEKAVFSGVWGYLDVEPRYVKKFKKELKKSLKVCMPSVHVVYNRYGNDVNVRWEL